MRLINADHLYRLATLYRTRARRVTGEAAAKLNGAADTCEREALAMARERIRRGVNRITVSI